MPHVPERHLQETPADAMELVGVAAAHERVVAATRLVWLTDPSDDATMACFHVSTKEVGGTYEEVEVYNAGTLLTIGPGVTVRGATGAIGYDPRPTVQSFGPPDVGVINQGRLLRQATVVELRGRGSLRVAAEFPQLRRVPTVAA